MSSRSRIPPLLFATLLGWMGALHAEPSVDDSERCRRAAVEAVERRHRDVKDLRVHFSQTTRLSAPNSAPQHSSGWAVLALPQRMRWRYQSPEESLLVSDGGTLWLYAPAFAEVQRLPVGEEGHLAAGAAQFLLGRSDLEAEFKVRASTCDPEGAVLELLPRKAASYQRLTLGVVLPAGDITWTELVDLLGNTTRLEFSDLAFDTKPEASLFSFDPPPGSKVIDLVP